MLEVTTTVTDLDRRAGIQADRQTQVEGQTDRTDKQMDDGQADMLVVWGLYVRRQRDGQTKRLIDKQKDGRLPGCTDRQNDEQTEGRTHRQTDGYTSKNKGKKPTIHIRSGT